MIEEARREPSGDVARAPDRGPRFRVGDAVRTLGGVAYERGEVAEKPRSYKVDYGSGFLTSIREENLERFDGSDPLSKPPNSFVPPMLPPFGWTRR